MIGSNFKISPMVEEKTYGKFVIEPLDQGFGQTLGNALRRTLLFGLKGAAITSVKIEGIRHQFTTIPGLKEDLVEFILNLKKIRLASQSDEPQKIKLSIKGQHDITAKDFVTPPSIEIVNKDLYLGSLIDKKSSIEIEATVEKGYGYLQAEENTIDTLGVIAIDALFSPIERVNYKRESTRVGRMTNLDKLIIEIWTDGTILPQASLMEAAKILTQFFKQIYNPQPIEEIKEVSPLLSTFDDNVLKLTVEELDLPTRIANCLKNAGIETVKDLTEKLKSDLVKIKNLGGKSIGIVEEKLKEKGLKLKE